MHIVSSMETFLLIFSFAVLLVIIFLLLRKRKPFIVPDAHIVKETLKEHVPFYRKLNDDEKQIFENRVLKFLQRIRITGVKVEVEDMDKIFIAAAAIIPIFAFEKWEYRNINEILLYPGSFTRDFMIEGGSRDTLGMVGNGPMQRTMILSRPDLRNGFLNQFSTTNTAIHEFVHLIDKSDGATDGLPEVLLQHSASLPWIHRMHAEIQKIVAGNSDINPYGITNEAEFLAVAAEYFFKQPGMMQDKHPELFSILEQIFSTSAYKWTPKRNNS